MPRRELKRVGIRGRFHVLEGAISGSKLHRFSIVEHDALGAGEHDCICETPNKAQALRIAAAMAAADVSGRLPEKVERH